MQMIMPYIMKERHDSMNMYEDTFNCEPWDIYIKEKEDKIFNLGRFFIPKEQDNPMVRNRSRDNVGRQETTPGFDRP